MQKSRVRWIKKGDRNSAYFHRVCKLKDAKKNLEVISVNGERLNQLEEIKNAITLKSFLEKGM